MRRLADALSRSGKAVHSPSPVAKLDLLRIARLTLEHHPDRETLVSQSGIVNIVQDLANNDEAVLVRRLAQEILPSLAGRSAHDATRPRSNTASLERHSGRSSRVPTGSTDRVRSGEASSTHGRYVQQPSHEVQSISRPSSSRSNHIRTGSSAPTVVREAIPTNAHHSSASGGTRLETGHHSSVSGAGRPPVRASVRRTNGLHPSVLTAVRPAGGSYSSVPAAIRSHGPHSSVPIWVRLPTDGPTEIRLPTDGPLSSVPAEFRLPTDGSHPSVPAECHLRTDGSRSSVSTAVRPAHGHHPSAPSMDVRPASHRPSESLSMPSKRRDDGGRPARRPFASKPEEVPAKHKRQISRSQLRSVERACQRFPYQH